MTIISIASVRLRLFFKERIIYHSSYLRELLDKCRSKGRSYDFTVRFSQSPPRFPRKAQKTVLNKITFWEVSDSLFVFKLDNVVFSVFFNTKTAEIARTNNHVVHDDTIITVLKILVSILVLDKGGLPLHSAAVCRRNRGYLFCGKSGSGKSTLAIRLRPRYTILSDEFNAVLPVSAQRNGYRVYASPFTKPPNFRFCTMTSCRVSKLFFFTDERKKSQMRSGISKKMMMSLLLENVFTFPTSDAFACTMFDNAASFITTVPVDLIHDRDAMLFLLHRKNSL
jgi:hypothetical protein